MSEKEKMINVLNELPENVSLKEVTEALNLLLELNNRIDDFNIDETISNDELLKEIQKW